MKEKIRLSLWCVVVLAWLPARADHRPLLPRPQQVDYGSGVLPVNGLPIRFVLPATVQDRFAAEQLAAGLSGILHVRVPVQEAGAAGPALVLNRTGDATEVPSDNEVAGPESREAYSIKVTGSGAEIRAGSSAGLFYGVQTLLQMVEGEAGQAMLPVADLRDWPALAYRGFMMDFSHGQQLRVSEIERQIELLAQFKANQYYF